AGPTPSATVVNQTKVAPPPVCGLVPGVSRRLSDAILRALAKDPRDRYPDCASLAREILAEVPLGAASGTGSGPSAFTLSGPDPDAAPDPRAVTAALPPAEEAPAPGSSGLAAGGP